MSWWWASSLNIARLILDFTSAKTLDKFCRTSIQLSSPSLFEHGRGHWQKAPASKWAPVIKKRCPISGLQLGVLKGACAVKVTWVKTFLLRDDGGQGGNDGWVEEGGRAGGGEGMIKQLPAFHSTNIESKRGDTCGRSTLNLLTHPFLNRAGSAPLITNFDKSCPADRGGSRAGRCGPVQLTRRHANNRGLQEGVD